MSLKSIDDFDFSAEQKAFIRILMERRVEHTHQAFFQRYGVESLQEMDEYMLFARSLLTMNSKRATNEADAYRTIVGRMAGYDEQKKLNSEEKRIRLGKELEQIAISRNAYVIEKVWEIAMACKDKNEPYILRGSLASLLCLYLLGAAHLDPTYIGSRYETAIGTQAHPKTISRIGFAIRPSFADAFFEKISSFFPGKEMFYIRIPKCCYFKQVLFVPEKSVGKITGKTVFVEGKRFLPNDLDYPKESLMVRVHFDKELQFAKDVLDINPNINYECGLGSIKFSLSHGYGFVLGNHLGKHLNKKTKVEDIESLVRIISKQTSLPNGEKTEGCPIDKDAVIDYLERKGLDNDESYLFMEALSKGKINKGAALDAYPEIIHGRLESITHLSTRAYSSELAYKYLLLSAGVWAEK